MEMDKGCLHVIGNGDVLIARSGMDIVSVKGNHLSGRNCFTGKIAKDELTESAKVPECREQRVHGENLWRYTFLTDENIAWEINEFITDRSCYIWECRNNPPFSYEITLDDSVITGEIFQMPAGVAYVNDYKTDHALFFRFYGNGITYTHKDRKLLLTFAKNARLVIAFSENSQELYQPSEGIYYNCKMPDISALHLSDIRLSDALEDFWYLCSSYSSPSGGIVGLEWNLCYIRDNYGVSRALLAAGFTQKAKALLEFYLKVWQKKGFLATAQSVGTDGAMHIHECDETENPGYLILQAFDYYLVTGDFSFMEELFPMLSWAMDVQIRHLYEGMMPFSGDETYTACNMIPRANLEDGSCESTMLFIKAAERMLSYRENEAWADALREAKSTFRRHFLRNGRLLANQPERSKAPLAPVKKGVCCYCFRYLDGLKPNPHRIYSCPDCMGKEDIYVPKAVILSCVELLPAYLHSNLLSLKELKQIYEKAALSLLQNGCFAGQGEQKRCSGYEYGLLLYGLVQVKSPYAARIYELVLNRRDTQGSWAEYYDDGKPAGMRYRCWEGGVNITALLAYAEKNGG